MFYELHIAQRLPQHCTTNSHIVIEMENQDSYISSDDIESSCINQNQPWILATQSGQSLNISLVNLGDSHGSDVYGTLKDQSTNREVVFGGGPREQHLMLSSEPLAVTIQTDALERVRFLLHIQGFHIIYIANLIGFSVRVLNYKQIVFFLDFLKAQCT